MDRTVLPAINTIPAFALYMLWLYIFEVISFHMTAHLSEDIYASLNCCSLLPYLQSVCTDCWFLHLAKTTALIAVRLAFISDLDVISHVLAVVYIIILISELSPSHLVC